MNAFDPLLLDAPETRRSSWRPWLFATAALVVAASLGAWSLGFRPWRGRTSTATALATLVVDQGDLSSDVVENGSLESANNTTVRCQVEALIGLTGGAQGTGTSGRSGGSSGRTSQPTAGDSSGSTQQASTSSNASSTSTAKGKAASKSKTSGIATAGAGASAAGNAAGSAGSASGGTTTATTAAGSASILATKPNIRSFSYAVPAYVPLRPKAIKPAQTKPAAPVALAGGGGSGRGRGGSTTTTEKPGSTRIISILPEGQRVSAGDVVCELDSAAFRDELQAQKIRYLQAKAWVEQAKSLLEVNEITLREYRDGIYPQDVQLIREYRTTCRVADERLRRNLDWSRATAKKGYRATSQVTADTLSLQQAEIALREAEGMAGRLEKYTAPRLIKALEAKIEANRSDQLAQQATFQLESDRQRKLEAIIAHCTLKAPSSGIVVYANTANRWGRVETQIQEGVTVREGQPIFYLPDPKHMQVKAKINESKVSLVQEGQDALIQIDAFPGRPLRGTVTEVTPIPSPSNGPFSDVRVYYAAVRIDSAGFDALRPGLSAEVTFHIMTRRHVTRVALPALRQIGETTYVALASPIGPGWRWQRVELGLSDPNYAEVTSGLKPGDRVVANPGSLPPPEVQIARADAKPALRLRLRDR